MLPAPLQSCLQPMETVDEPPRERETMKASAPPLLLLRRRPRAEA